MQSSEDLELRRFRKIHWNWQITWLRNVGKRWWRTLIFDSVSLAVLYGFAVACVPIDAALWSWDFRGGVEEARPFGDLLNMLPDKAWWVFSGTALINGVLIDRYLAANTPGEAFRPKTWRYGRFVLCCIPLVSLGVTYFWKQQLPRIPIRPVKERSNVFAESNPRRSGFTPWLTSTKSLIKTLPIMFYLMIVNCTWHLALAWHLSDPTALFPAKPLILTATSLCYHSLLALSLWVYLQNLVDKRQIRIPLLFRWAIVCVAVIPITGFSLAAIMIGSIPGFRSYETFVNKHFTPVAGAGKATSWLYLTEWIRRKERQKAGRRKFRFETLSRPHPDTNREQAMVTRFCRVKLMYFTIELFGFFWVMTLIHPMIGTLSFGLAFISAALMGTCYLAALLYFVFRFYTQSNAGPVRAGYRACLGGLYASIIILFCSLNCGPLISGNVQVAAGRIAASSALMVTLIGLHEILTMMSSLYKPNALIPGLSILVIFPFIAGACTGPPVLAGLVILMLLVLALLSPLINIIILWKPYRWIIKPTGDSRHEQARRLRQWTAIIGIMPFGALLLPVLFYVRYAHEKHLEKLAST